MAFKLEKSVDDINKVDESIRGLYTEKETEAGEKVWHCKKDVYAAFEGSDLKKEIEAKTKSEKELKDKLKEVNAKLKGLGEPAPKKEDVVVADKEVKADNIDNIELKKQIDAQKKALEDMTKKSEEQQAQFQNKNKDMLIRECLNQNGGVVELLLDKVSKETKVFIDEATGDLRILPVAADGSRIFEGTQEKTLQDHIDELKAHDQYSLAFKKVDESSATGDFSNVKGKEIGTINFDGNATPEEAAAYLKKHGSKEYIKASKAHSDQKIKELQEIKSKAMGAGF